MIRFRQSILMAYRSYISLIDKGLHIGKRNRVVIPSCVVWAIRNKFPEDDPSQYTGFKDTDLQSFVLTKYVHFRITIILLQFIIMSSCAVFCLS